MSRLIPLTQGQHAIVDDEDYDQLSQRKWFFVNGYAVCAVPNPGGEPRQKHIRMHRLIAGATEEELVDHINHNRLDNRRCNLRICTIAESQRNRRKFARTRYNEPPASQYKGVQKDEGRWRATIRVNGKKIHLGCFINELEAARAYDEAARHYHGEFAQTNF